MNFRDQYQCEYPQPTEREQRAMNAARAYDARCDDFDRTVCTGMFRGEPVPTGAHEAWLVNRNAIAVREAVLLEFAIEAAELRHALVRTRRDAPTSA